MPHGAETDFSQLVTWPNGRFERLLANDAGQYRTGLFLTIGLDIHPFKEVEIAGKGLHLRLGRTAR